MRYHCRVRRMSLGLLVLLSVESASAKDLGDATAKDLDAEVKKLLGKGAPSKRWDAMMKFLGVSRSCPAECKEIASAKVLTANLDGDSDDERVLAITTVGDGACAAASLEVFVLDPKPKGFASLAHTHLHLSGGAKPLGEVTATKIHSASVKDLVLRVDGQCPGSAREQSIRVVTLEHGKLEELASSETVPELASYAVHGAPPATIELKDSKATTTLYFDSVAFAYDALPPYEPTMKNSVSKDTDDVLTTKQCAAPISAAVAAACKVSGTATIQVAVREGQPIGLTVTTTPEQPPVVRCLRKKVARATWDSTPAVSGCKQTFTVK